MPISEKDWIDAKELSKRLGISASSVYRLARAGKLESRHFGKKLQFRYNSNIQTPTTTVGLWTKLLAALDQSAEKYYDHPRFVLFAGLASIIGLILAILVYVYPQEVRPRTFVGEPFRVTYLRVGGAAIDLLSKGELSAKWERILGGQPFIIPNSVFNELTFLVKNFSTPRFWDDVQVSRSRTDDSERYYVREDTPDLEKGLEQFKGKTFFVGSQWSPSPTIPLGRTDLLNLIDEIKNNANWFLEFAEWMEDEHNTAKFLQILDSGFMVPQFYFTRKVDTTDIEPFRRKMDRSNSPHGQKVFNFYNHVIRNSLPPNFFKLSLRYHGCGSFSALELDWDPLFLEVAVIENSHSETIDVGDFFVKENSLSHLRKYHEEVKLFEKASPQRVKYYPQRLLKPGEKILVPLRLVFKSDRPRLSTKNRLIGLDFRLKLLERLQALPGDLILPVVDTIPKNETLFELTVRDWIKILDRDPRPLEIDREFVFGRSVVIEKIEINGKVFDVRQFDPERFVIQTSEAKGSCPFVYVRSKQSDKWHNQGHILYGRSTKEKEGADEVALREFDGRVLIRENDPETSFIDFLYVRVDFPDGTTKILLPKHPLVRRLDGTYLTLEQGQEIEIEFDTHAGQPTGKFFIGAHGYYRPYQENWTILSSESDKNGVDVISRRPTTAEPRQQ